MCVLRSAITTINSVTFAYLFVYYLKSIVVDLRKGGELNQ